VDPDHIRELFIEFGPIVVRRMFGAAGLYADGVMFDLVSGGQIYLKADAATAAAFEREGCAPFEYGTKTGKRASKREIFDLHALNRASSFVLESSISFAVCTRVSTIVRRLSRSFNWPIFPTRPPGSRCSC
jgi:TfoX/Sxy family transcriptional regulator of competence genes